MKPILQKDAIDTNACLQPVGMGAALSSDLRDEDRAYSRRQWTGAVNFSAFLGWLVVSVPITSQISDGRLSGFTGLTAAAAAVGLPVAFAASWLITAPILKRAMRTKITWLGAALWGGAIAFVIALVSIVTGRVRGLMHATDPNASFQLGGGDKVIEIDGILTAYGWFVLSQRTAVFIGLGCVIALVVRAVIGPGSKS